jgi:hypothetical protein
MRIKMNRTLTVPEELASILRQLADILEEDEDFTNACFAICNRDSEFKMKDGYADIIYEGE